MVDPARTDHAAEAEQLLVWAEGARQQDNLDHAAVLAQMATAHFLGALLASRPAEIRVEKEGPVTLPEVLRRAFGEPDPTAVHEPVPDEDQRHYPEPQKGSNVCVCGALMSDPAVHVPNEEDLYRPVPSDEGGKD